MDIRRSPADGCPKAAEAVKVIAERYLAFSKQIPRRKNLFKRCTHAVFLVLPDIERGYSTGKEQVQTDYWSYHSSVALKSKRKVKQKRFVVGTLLRQPVASVITMWLVLHGKAPTSRPHQSSNLRATEEASDRCLTDLSWMQEISPTPRAEWQNAR